jgi:hypothetical protein
MITVPGSFAADRAEFAAVRTASPREGVAAGLDAGSGCLFAPWCFAGLVRRPVTFSAQPAPVGGVGGVA